MYRPECDLDDVRFDRHVEHPLNDPGPVDEVTASYEAYKVAKAAFEAARTPENMEAVRAAWAAYDATLPRRKKIGFACRAGQRQAREARERRGR